jgi:hypothetical protein
MKPGKNLFSSFPPLLFRILCILSLKTDPLKLSFHLTRQMGSLLNKLGSSLYCEPGIETPGGVPKLR